MSTSDTGGRYVYVIPTPDVFGDPIHGTRHDAKGEKAILEAIHPGWELEIRARKRYATDPV